MNLQEIETKIRARLDKFVADDGLLIFGSLPLNLGDLGLPLMEACVSGERNTNSLLGIRWQFERVLELEPNWNPDNTLLSGWDDPENTYQPTEDVWFQLGKRLHQDYKPIHHSIAYTRIRHISFPNRFHPFIQKQS